MRTLWTATLLASSISLNAQALEDVIYKKDGSVLRGTLVEQDFENGRYKIQLEGGSLFSVSKDDIEKITKEKSYSQTERDLDAVAAESKATLNSQQPINIHIENNPSINQTASISPQAPQKSTPEHVFFIGTMGKSYVNEYENGTSYSGLNLSYQRNFNEHWALYTALNTGSISAIIIDGEEYDPAGIDTKISQLQIAAQVSTNNYEGWQFFAGLGLFSERLSDDYDSETYSGSSLHLGLGYGWQTLEAKLRITADSSSDYRDGIASSTANLQLGFLF